MKTFVLYHIAAFEAGLLLDLLVGDPRRLPHPIRMIGALIAALEKRLARPIDLGVRNPRAEFARGAVLWALVVLAAALATGVLTVGAYAVDLRLGALVEAVLTCYILAAKSLRDECMKVYAALRNGTLDDARRAVAMIVGRDVDALDADGVTRAAVETAAENASDGIVAPMLYTCLGGPILGMIYKAVNTMDSMIGYRNDRYEFFGKFAARADDAANFLPSRITALVMIAASFVLGKDYSDRNAWRVFKRDRFNHKSPNSAQTESVCAGALGLRLAGDARYFGKLVKKPFIGDELRAIEPRDIPRACRLVSASEFFAMTLCLAVLAAVYFAL